MYQIISKPIKDRTLSADTSQRTTAYALGKLIRQMANSAKILGAVFVGMVCISPARAYAIYCSNCSTFYQQMFEYVEQVNTALNTAEQLQTQIQQYQNMVSQGTSLPNSMFGSIAADLKNVANIYNRSAFPGFESYLNQAAKSVEAPNRDRYEKWSVQGRDNVKTAMKAADLNTGAFESEDAQLARMVSRSQSAVGRMQAIQAGNEIASQNVQQLQKLRDLLATQINMQGNYMAQQVDRKAAGEATEQQFEARENTRGGVKGY